ncbi:MAG: cytochrome c family protein [Alphaproteobacteria bacterium]|nr:cytochrome c family protein [Alphaproteobacteria bacterium]
MDTYELNKWAGAVLAAGLLLMVISEIGNLVVHPKTLKETAIAVAVPEEAGAPSSPAAPAEKAVPLPELLAAADATRGAAIAKRCTSCHTFDKGGKNLVGPNLFAVAGRDPGKVAGFSYSSAITGLGKPWSWENLDAYLNDPKGFAPGTKMAFAGVKKSAERADLLAYLKQNHDSPPAFPAK